MLTKKMTIADYEAIKCKTLRKYGCPEKELWLTEVESIDGAKRWYGSMCIDDLCNWHPEAYKGCVYYHESGSIGAFAPFSTMEEFEEGCKYIADYLK